MSDEVKAPERIWLDKARGAIHESAELIANCYCAEEDDFRLEVKRLESVLGVAVQQYADPRPSVDARADDVQQIINDLDSCAKYFGTWEDDSSEYSQYRESILRASALLASPSLADAVGEVERLHTKLDSEDYALWAEGVKLAINTLKSLQPVAQPEDKTKMNEVGWLLEKMHSGQVYYIEADGILKWTADPNKALRLSRRVDAEALCTIVEDCDKVASHEWAGSTRPAESQGYKRRPCSKCGEGLGFNWQGPLCERCDGESDESQGGERVDDGDKHHGR